MSSSPKTTTTTTTATKTKTKFEQSQQPVYVHLHQGYLHILESTIFLPSRNENFACTWCVYDFDMIQVLITCTMHVWVSVRMNFAQCCCIKTIIKEQTNKKKYLKNNNKRQNKSFFKAYTNYIQYCTWIQITWILYNRFDLSFVLLLLSVDREWMDE